MEMKFESVKNFYVIDIPLNRLYLRINTFPFPKRSSEQNPFAQQQLCNRQEVICRWHALSRKAFLFQYWMGGGLSLIMGFKAKNRINHVRVSLD
jgi:hypothetical protein